MINENNKLKSSCVQGVFLDSPSPGMLKVEYLKANHVYESKQLRRYIKNSNINLRTTMTWGDEI